MSAKIIISLISITIIKTKLIQCIFLDAESNYHKSKLDRNNIVNKGVWIRNNINDNNLFAKGTIGEFIFGHSSIDADNLQQSNYDAFHAFYNHDTQSYPEFSGRQKRSGYSRENRRRRKSINNENEQNKKYDITDLIQSSKIISAIRPASVINDYPYQLAVLLNNKRTYLDNIISETLGEKKHPTNVLKQFNNITVANYENINNSQRIVTSVAPTKKSGTFDFETEIIKNIDNTDPSITDNVTTRENRNIAMTNYRNAIDKDTIEWQKPPISDINIYKIVPKGPPQKTNSVTDKGLVKVISMLTKTYKKLTNQHIDIKEMQQKMQNIYEEFIKNSTSLTNKFKDFDLKYSHIIKFCNKLKELEEKIIANEEYLKTKEKNMWQNLKQFENQQKEFLNQQTLFYNIQKVILSQNEKINLKQNLIAKTQSEISFKQNSFARMLNKHNQINTENKIPPATTILNPNVSKLKEPQSTFASGKPQPPEPTPTDFMKINLFSLPTLNKIQGDLDELMLKEKDDQEIDDLVYKFYFNNTFIDDYMKSKVFNSFNGNTEHHKSIGNVKNKRTELKTILLPILEADKPNKNTNNNRERRWINHHSKNKNKRKNRNKVSLAHVFNASDANPTNQYRKSFVNDQVLLSSNADNNDIKKDPFMTMATNFCNEIHQNANQQMLRWCIEKALRRLQILDANMLSTPELNARLTQSTTTSNNSTVTQQLTEQVNSIPLLNDKYKYDYLSEKTVVTNPTVSSYTSKPTELPVETTPVLLVTDTTYENVPTKADISQFVLNFPDNEELESNLKQFDLVPDTEGNVYYDDSIHISDLKLDSESQGAEDFLPEYESNSRTQVDPLSSDGQDKRQALIRKLNKKIKMSLG